EGAVPEAGVIDSQLPPAGVCTCAAADQLSVPVPALEMENVWLGGSAPPCWPAKLNTVGLSEIWGALLDGKIRSEEMQSFQLPHGPGIAVRSGTSDVNVCDAPP